MLSKCLNFRDKQWKECYYKRREQPYNCFICKVVIKEKDRNDHMSKHYNEAELYLTFSMYKLNKHNCYFWVITNKCRLCVYLSSRLIENFCRWVTFYTVFQ